MPQPGILYALVARGPTILAEYSSVQGNSGIVALQILEKLTANPGDRLSYLIDNHVFHCLSTGGLVYMCMTEQSFGRRLPFAFLEDVHGRFAAAHGAAAPSAAAYSLNAAFLPVLRARAAHFSDPQADALTRVAGEVTSLREVMVDSIERVLERGERLELLVARTEGLAEGAFVFKRGAGALRRQMWWKDKRAAAAVAAAALAALYLLAAMLCGPKLQC